MVNRMSRLDKEGKPTMRTCKKCKKAGKKKFIFEEIGYKKHVRQMHSSGGWINDTIKNRDQLKGNPLNNDY